MGIFHRIADIISANVNDLIDRAEDPEKMAKQVIREMEESIGEVRGQVARAMAAEHQVAARHSAAQAETMEWEQRALKALELEKEDLARQALQKRRDAERSGKALGPQLEQAQHSTQLLREQLRSLEDRIMLARRKRDTIIARQRMARAQSQVSQSLGRFEKAGDHLSRLSQLADRVDELEARASAELVLMNESLPLERQLECLEEGQDIEAQLAMLKRRLGGGESSQP